MGNWKNVSSLIEYSDGGILSKKIIGKDRFDATLFCMAKGTELSEHTSTKRGLVYVIEGKGEFNLMGEKIDMVPGVLIHMDKDSTHSLKAAENTSFLLLLF